MGMDVCMLGATILATPFSSDAGVSSSLQSMAMSYFDDFVLVFKDKLLPVLVRTAYPKVTCFLASLTSHTRRRTSCA